MIKQKLHRYNIFHHQLDDRTLFIHRSFIYHLLLPKRQWRSHVCPFFHPSINISNFLYDKKSTFSLLHPHSRKKKPRGQETCLLRVFSVSNMSFFIFWEKEKSCKKEPIFFLFLWMCLKTIFSRLSKNPFAKKWNFHLSFS